MLQLMTNERSRRKTPGFVQPKLEIGKPDDKYEKEADAVADKVMRMPDPSNHVQMKRNNGVPDISMKCAKCEEEEKLQMKPSIQRSSNDGPQFASNSVAKRLNNSKGGGHVLPSSIGYEMGSKIGNDFGAVRIHTDANAIRMNRELGAKAFTHGNDVYFNSGQYNPSSSEGKRLLAHELTHVVQQGNSTNSIQRACGRDNDRTVDGFPATYIEHIDVNVTNPCRVTLRWTGPDASSQPTGPFHATIGNGAGRNNCDNTADSNVSGSNCTPKGDFTIERQACSLGAFPDAKNASYFQSARGIAFHYWPNRPNCPASHGCVRMSMEHSELIWDNCINERTAKGHGKPATTVHVGGTWSACGS
ncbi:MAG: DUF4157 domain-containing protein [Bacteroidota bacterium]